MMISRLHHWTELQLRNNRHPHGLLDDVPVKGKIKFIVTYANVVRLPWRRFKRYIGIPMSTLFALSVTVVCYMLNEHFLLVANFTDRLG